MVTGMGRQLCRKAPEFPRTPGERFDPGCNDHAPSLPLLTPIGGEMKAFAVLLDVLDFLRMEEGDGLLLEPLAVVYESTEWQRRAEAIPRHLRIVMQRERALRVGEMRTCQWRTQLHASWHMLLPKRHGFSEYVNVQCICGFQMRRGRQTIRSRSHNCHVARCHYVRLTSPGTSSSMCRDHGLPIAAAHWLFLIAAITLQRTLYNQETSWPQSVG